METSSYSSSFSNLQILNFELRKQNTRYSKLIKNNFMLTLPDIILNHNIDGYFASYLEKIK